MASNIRIKGATTQPVLSDRGSFGSEPEDEVRSQRLLQRKGQDIRRALERLRLLLASGEPLRDDVPRGYYLNIVV